MRCGKTCRQRRGVIGDRWITFWRLILISLHLKCDVFQFAPAFNLKDDRITRSEMADQDLELSGRL